MEKMREKFVVIGSDVSFGIQRTKCESVEQAVEHAKRLIQKQNQCPGTELWVVQVVAKVRVLQPVPPIEVVAVAP